MIEEQLFSSVMEWEPSDGLDDFKLRAAKLAHFTCHRLPIERGTAATTELMIKAIANSKGISLGEVGQMDDIGWAWKALVTPDTDAYAEWFKDNIFQDAVLDAGLVHHAP